ncbi:hypothetical protein FB470_003878 [Amycolatopsis thermophila]|uniref:Uncharacterized protein n=1 Tax=Amycolatopsis thermophila TaxID=206084 RepID=A0ABU0EXP5_9PSEU|nr:hypothetical protein [Amycolatopsis thermophila]
MASGSGISSGAVEDAVPPITTRTGSRQRKSAHSLPRPPLQPPGGRQREARCGLPRPPPPPIPSPPLVADQACQGTLSRLDTSARRPKPSSRRGRGRSAPQATTQRRRRPGRRPEKKIKRCPRRTGRLRDDGECSHLTSCSGSLGGHPVAWPRPIAVSHRTHFSAPSRRKPTRTSGRPSRTVPVAHRAVGCRHPERGPGSDQPGSDQPEAPSRQTVAFIGKRSVVVILLTVALVTPTGELLVRTGSEVITQSFYRCLVDATAAFS